MYDLGTSLMNLMLDQQRQFCESNDIKPHVLICGCCTFGCVCTEHESPAKGTPQNICWYHKLETPGKKIDGLMELVAQKVNRRFDTQLLTDSPSPIHIQDEDCDVDETTGLCRTCGVGHDEPCVDCGGRGFHRPHCPQMGGAA